jgi:hypothetical protein
MGMDRRQTTYRRRGAFWLLLMALVSVVAPVFADTYVCPMAAAANEDVSPCCAKSIAAQQTSAPGSATFQASCDCPKLSWAADVNDQVRELRTGSENNIALLSPIPVVRTSLVVGSNAVRRIHRETNRSSPPLWLRNQSILC